MGASGDDTGLLERHHWTQSKRDDHSKQEDVMMAIKYLAPSLAAAAIGGAIVLAPIASAATHVAPTPSASSSSAPAGTDPLVPYGTDPVVPYRLGYINPSHDEGNTTNGQLDVPF